MADNFSLNDDINEQPTPTMNVSPNDMPPEATRPALTPQHMTQQSLLGAVEAHFMAQRSRAVANINGYLHATAGVAEHPDVVEEVIKLICSIDDADSKLQTLQRIIQTP